MSDPKDLPYSVFLKEAFSSRVPVPFLGGLPVNYLGLLGFGVAGLINPGFWLIGAALEILLVGSLSSHPRFRNYVRGRRLQAASQASSQDWSSRIEAIYSELEDDSRVRYDRLVSRCGRVRALSQEASTELLSEVAEDGLLRLQWIFLKLLTSREFLNDQLDQSVREELQEELEEHTRRLATTTDERLRRSLESTADILRKRLATLRAGADHIAFMDSELRRIEHQAELIVEEASLAKDPEALSGRIDAVTSTFSETQDWMRLNRELLGDADDDEPRRAPGRALAR